MSILATMTHMASSVVETQWSHHLQLLEAYIRGENIGK